MIYEPELLEWKRQAACRDLPVSLFYPSRGTPNSEIQAAKNVCHGCPVQPSCFRWAYERNERGIWGGTSKRDRAKLRRELKALTGSGELPLSRLLR